MTKNKTTQPVNAFEIASRINAATAELAAANADVALLQRLKDAEANADRLTAELATLQGTADTIETNANEAKRQEAFARIRNMSITAITPSDNPTAGNRVASSLSSQVIEAASCADSATGGSTCMAMPMRSCRLLRSA